MTGTAKALLRYLLTGGAAAAVDILGFPLLCSARVPVLLAAASSFAVATMVNFLLTSRWVFRAALSRRRYLRFLVGATVALITNVALTYAGMTYLGLPSTLAKASAIGATFLPNFLFNAHIVFRGART